MHQQGSGGSRIFVPPFDDPYDPNVHPIIAQGIMTVGQAMASALVSEGKAGVEWLSRYDLWAPARQYMLYHGQPRILTEIASVESRRSAGQRGRGADGAAGGALEFPAAVPEERLAAARHRRLRQYRGVCRDGARRQVPRGVARELLPHPRRLGEPDRPAVRVRRPRLPARSVRDLRDARHPPHRRGGDPPGEGGVQGGRQGLRRRARG